MTKEEAKARIKEEFMTRYQAWLNDRFELDDLAYGRKYGWQKTEKLLALKDNLSAVVIFQKYIFSGMTQEGWEKAGVVRQAVWGLRSDGWLSAEEGRYRRPTYYYLTQQRAKEIWKEAKS